MTLPAQSDLLGLDWGFGGGVHAPLTAKSSLTQDAPEWSFAGGPAFFAATSAEDPNADRRVTAVHIQALMRNPSLAEGRITQELLHVLRSNDRDDAPRQVTVARVQVVRSSMRFGARPGVTVQTVWGDDQPAGVGEYAPEGYWQLAAFADGWYGQPQQPDTQIDGKGWRAGNYELSWRGTLGGSTESPLKPGQSFQANSDALVRAIIGTKKYEGVVYNGPAGEALGDFRVRVRNNQPDTPYEGAPTHHWVAMPIEHFNNPNQSLSSNTAPVYPGVDLDRVFDVGLSALSPTPLYYTWMVHMPPQAMKWQGPLVRMCQTYSAAPVVIYGQEQTETRQMCWFGHSSIVDPTFPDFLRNTSGPIWTVQKRLGRGEYRVVPDSFRDFSSETVTLPTATGYPLLYRRIFPEPENLLQALQDTPNVHVFDESMSNSLGVSPTDPDPLQYPSYSGLHIGRWTALSENNNAAWKVNDDGMYVTASGETRYRRHKTITLGLLVNYVHNQATFTVGGEFLDYHFAATYFVDNALGNVYTTFALLVHYNTEDGDPIRQIINDAVFFWSDTEVYTLAEVFGWTFAELSAAFTEYVLTNNATLLPELQDLLDATEAALPPPGGGLRPRVATTGGEIKTPVLYIEKLDSPSTHFADPEDTPGVDNLRDHQAPRSVTKTALQVLCSNL